MVLQSIINSILLAIGGKPDYRCKMATTQKSPPRLNRSAWVRWILAGPVAIIVALTLLAGMPLWLPGGAAGIDNLVIPLILAPLIWAALFFHACLDRSLVRVALVAGALFILHGALVVSRFVG